MTRRVKRTAIAVGVVAVVGLGGAAVAGAVGDDDASEKAITGPALQQASRAALAHTGGGQVTGTEVGDEESLYEVEVTKDGTQTDVQLDKAFQVVGDKVDKEDGS